MKHILLQWYDRYFSEPSAWVLLSILVFSFSIIYFWGALLAPVLTSVVLAYLLEGLLSRCLFWCPRLYAVFLIYAFFLILLALLCFEVTPLLMQQMSHLLQQMPVMLNKGQDLLTTWQAQYPELIPQSLLSQVIRWVADSFGNLGKNILSFSLSSIPGVFSILVYLVLVPMLVFFMMKDKDQLLNWFDAHLPSDRHLVDQIWTAVHAGLGQYVRGKVIEALLVALASYGVFAWFGLQYAFLMSVLIGFSAFIPYIGGIVVSIPIVMIALFQWGITPRFGWFISMYLLVQALDANVLVPILFSEAVNIHPVGIIIAILLFGGLWGVWGLFFAIPLAVLFKAIFDQWPRSSRSVALKPCI